MSKAPFFFTDIRSSRMVNGMTSILTGIRHWHVRVKKKRNKESKAIE
jgi:hypothetical protein